MSDHRPGPVKLDVYRTRVPMRTFEHSAASRELAEGIVVRVTFADGSCGWGEALPRPYVTGETIESVLSDLSQILWPACLSGGELPGLADGRCILSAAGAVELALVSRLFGRGGQLAPEDVPDLPLPEAPHGIAGRVSGVVGSSDPARTAARLWKMRLFDLRDFKVKLGLGEDVDRENLRIVAKKLAGRIAAGQCTLRVDVNGAWPAAEVPDRVAELVGLGVCVVEQPAKLSAAALAELAGRCALPLMADESLLTAEDARALLAAPDPRRVWWNLRIGKNGGWRPTAVLAFEAARRGVPFVAGCLVGESSILSAAQRRLLQWVPTPRFIEGNWGRFLMRDDLTYRSLRFTFGGRLRVMRRAGLGVDVDPRRLERYGTLVASLGD
ncbi:MAG: hypothetical protein NTV86_16245 [Planctomycetota bacterium]|nr:hypothetical protein [Planctomycetota bacterium]